MDQQRRWSKSHINMGKAQTHPNHFWVSCSATVISQTGIPGQLFAPHPHVGHRGPLKEEKPFCWCWACAKLPHWMHKIVVLNSQPFQSFPKTFSKFLVAKICPWWPSTPLSWRSAPPALWKWASFSVLNFKTKRALFCPLSAQCSILLPSWAGGGGKQPCWPPGAFAPGPPGASEGTFLPNDDQRDPH